MKYLPLKLTMPSSIIQTGTVVFFHTNVRISSANKNSGIDAFHFSEPEPLVLKMCYECVYCTFTIILHRNKKNTVYAFQQKNIKRR